MTVGTIGNYWAENDWCAYAWCEPTRYNALHTQLEIVTLGDLALHIQTDIVSYNTTQLRILWEIKSDGIDASNYTASSEQSTDKGVINLKSDLVEKYWQSTGAAAEWVQWDAGAGETISLDTIGLIDHNLTSSAVVELRGFGGSGDAAPGSWGSVPVYATMTLSDDPTETNLIWISDEAPTSQYRHWYLTIQDPTNPDGFVRIGRLVAGSSLIIDGQENCLDEIDYWRRNYKDEFRVNGFSGVANNRALKKNMTIRFRNLETVSLTNYRKLNRYSNYVRDTLKALVIVDPENPYKFTVFSKLADMPKESHRYVDASTSYTTFDMTFDEAR